VKHDILIIIIIIITIIGKGISRGQKAKTIKTKETNEKGFTKRKRENHI
jgi:hypothetical protein